MIYLFEDIKLSACKIQNCNKINHYLIKLRRSDTTIVNKQKKWMNKFEKYTAVIQQIIQVMIILYLHLEIELIRVLQAQIHRHKLLQTVKRVDIMSSPHYEKGHP